MGLLTYTYTFTAGTKARASEANKDLADIKDVLNGNVDSANLAALAVTSASLGASSVDATKLASSAVRQTHGDYTSANSGLLVWQMGPNYAGANGGIIARVSKTITLTTATSQTFTITFATDCVDGNPAFGATPTTCGLSLGQAAGSWSFTGVCSVAAAAITSTTCPVRIDFASAPSGGGAILSGIFAGQK